MVKRKKEENDVVSSWEKIAREEGTDVSKNWVYGDRLYEEEFGKKYAKLLKKNKVRGIKRIGFG